MMNNSFANFDENQSHMEIQDHGEDKGEDSSSSSAVHFHGLKTDGEFAAFYKNGNLEYQEEAALVTPENEEDFKNEREMEKQEIRNKLIKNALVLKAVSILLVCLLLWNFVLVVIVMSFMSSPSSPNPTPEFSAHMNLTQENMENFQQLLQNLEKEQSSDKLKFDEIKRRMNSTEEKFENSMDKKLAGLRNSTEVKFESLKNSKQTEIESSIHFAEGKMESWRNQTEEQLENLKTFTEEKIDSFNGQFETLQNDTKVDVAEQAEKLAEAEEKWSNLRTELTIEISEISKLIRNLENQTNQMEFNAQDLRRKVGPLLNKFAATHLDTEFCGGAVSIPEMMAMQYSPPSNWTSSSPCAWLVWSTATTQIKMRINDLEQGQLTIYQSFDPSESWTSSSSLTRGNLFQENSISSNIALLVFTPSSSSSSNSRGFEVEFTRGPTISGSVLVPTMSDENPAVRKQVPSSSGFGHNERRFYIVYPPPGQKVNLTMESIDTEANYDHVRIFKFGASSSPQNFQLVQTYTGAKTIGQSFEGGNSQPILLYFTSDGSGASNGFRASIVTVQV